MKPLIRTVCGSCGHLSGWLQNPEVGGIRLQCSHCEASLLVEVTIFDLLQWRPRTKTSMPVAAWGLV